MMTVLKLLLSATAAGLTGCATAPRAAPTTPSPAPEPRPAAECSPSIPANAVPLARAGLTALVGRFAFIEVATSNSVRGPMQHVSQSSLTLELADSAQRAAAGMRSVGRERREDLQLLGRREKTAWGTSSEPAEVDRGVLWLGCRDCTHSYGTAFHIDGVSAAGFFGQWVARDAGFAVVVDVGTGKTQPLGDTYGYFCAWREK
jgi:hypothetical protein